MTEKYCYDKPVRAMPSADQPWEATVCANNLKSKSASDYRSTPPSFKQKFQSAINFNQSTSTHGQWFKKTACSHFLQTWMHGPVLAMVALFSSFSSQKNAPSVIARFVSNHGCQHLFVVGVNAKSLCKESQS